MSEVQDLCISFDDILNTDDEADQDAIILLTVAGAGNPVTVNVSAGDNLATINAAIVEALDEADESSNYEVEIVDDCVRITWDAGVNQPTVTGAVVAANPTEVQTVTISGANVDAGVASLVFGGYSVTANLAAAATSAQAATALANAINTADGSANIVNATVVGSVITLEYFGTTDPALAVSGFASSNTTLDGVTVTTTPFAAFAPGFDGSTIVITEGAAEINPALGYDIFDVTDIVGQPGPGYFLNTQQLHNGEYAAVDALVDQLTNGVTLIDRLAGVPSEFAYSTAQLAPAGNELGRLQEMVTAADNTSQTAANTHLVITVDNNPGDPDGTVGRFYQVNDGIASRDATVTFLGTVVLGGYDVNDNPLYKNPIGNWDAMTIANFTYQTPTQLMATYEGGLI